MSHHICVSLSLVNESEENVDIPPLYRQAQSRDKQTLVPLHLMVPLHLSALVDNPPAKNISDFFWPGWGLMWWAGAFCGRFASVWEYSL